MNSCQRILIAALLAGLPLSASAQTVSRTGDGYEISVEHQFSIDRADGIIEVEAYLGSIILEGTDFSVTTITETFVVEVDSEQEARDMATRFASTVSKSGRRIEIRNRRGMGAGRVLTIALESGMRAFVSTLAGDIEARGGTGKLQLETGAGSVTVHGVIGSVDAKSGAGDVDMERISGDVTIMLGAGDVSLNGIEASVELVTGAGDIEIDGVDGSVDAVTAGGDIEASNIYGPIALSTAGGTIEINDVNGNAILSTAGGSIEMDRIVGDVRATTLGGDVEAGSIEGEIVIETMAGDIVLYDVTRGIDVVSEVGDIDVYVSDASFLTSEIMELRAENGNVEIHLPRGTEADIRFDLGFHGSLDTRRLSSELILENVRRDALDGSIRRALGRLNGGGGRIEVKTGSGDVILSDRGIRRDRD